VELEYPLFFTASGVGTLFAEGGFPIKFDKKGGVEIASTKKETRKYGEREYLLEEAITGDYSLVKAWKADTKGNLIFF